MKPRIQNTVQIMQGSKSLTRQTLYAQYQSECIVSQHTDSVSILRKLGILQIHLTCDHLYNTQYATTIVVERN